MNLDLENKNVLITGASRGMGLGIAKSFIHIDLLNADDGFEMRPNSWVY